MKKLLFLLLLLLPCLSHAQNNIDINSGGAAQTGYFATIPYENFKYNLIITLQLNGKPRRFIFDTGASVVVISKSLRDELNLEKITSVPVRDQSGKTDSLQIVKLDTIPLGGVNFYNIHALVMEANFPFSCFNVDGFIGSNMLRNSIVRISSKDRTIVLTDDKNKLPLAQKNSSKLFFMKNNYCPYVEVELKNKKSFKEKVLFDSGDDDLYKLYSSYFDDVMNRKIPAAVVEGHGSNSMGLFGAADNVQMYCVSIPEIIINGASLQGVKAETTQHKSSRLGAALLDYGIVTVDYKNRRFYFEPFQKTTIVTDNYFPISPTMDTSRRLSVGIIWDRKLEEQISVGDQIVSIDGIDYSNVSGCDIITKESFFPKEKDSIIIRVKTKTGAVKDIVLNKNRMVGDSTNRYNLPL